MRYLLRDTSAEKSLCYLVCFLVELNLRFTCVSLFAVIHDELAFSLLTKLLQFQWLIATLANLATFSKFPLDLLSVIWV